MLKKSLTTRENYYVEAHEWRSQNYESLRVWLNRCLLGLIIVTILLGISISSNLLLFPLQKTTAFLYTVNETTGEVTQLGEIASQKFNANWLMTRFLLIRYVVNRESYDADNLDVPYQIAWAMSAPAIAQTYADNVRTDNPQSPYAHYGKNNYVTVHVLAVDQLNTDTALVRFEQTLHQRDSGSEQTIAKEAIIRWQYLPVKTTVKMLDRDPLGFKVTYYQVTQVNMEEKTL